MEVVPFSGLREERQEASGDRQDVLRPFPQRRQPDLEHVEPVEEVFSESAVPHFFFEILVGGGDDPHVGPPGLAFPETLEGFFLQKAKQLTLQTNPSSPTSSRNKVPVSACSTRPG